jgi:hypothetical protein
MGLRQNRMFAGLVLVLGRFCTAWAQEQPVILGVLEDTPGRYYGDPNYRSVRIVFRKEGPDWKAFPSDCLGQACAVQYPPAMTWTIGFDGRNVGRITTSNAGGSHFYSDIGQQKIASLEPIPTTGKPSQEFAGFLNGPVYRPLIANSKPYFRDPEHWKSTQLSNEIVGLLRKAFRLKFPKVSNCENDGQSVEKPWLYKDEDIKIPKAYSSNASWSHLSDTGNQVSGQSDVAG